MSHNLENTKMNKDAKEGPSLFCEFGNKATELLADGYVEENILLSVSTSPSCGVTLTSTAAKDQERSLTGVRALYDDSDAIIDFRLDSSSSHVDSEDLVSGKLFLTKEFRSTTTANACLAFPDYISSHLSMWSYHEHAALSISAALSPCPEVTLAATTGSPSVAFGLEMGMMKKIPKSWSTLWTAGIQVTKLNWDAFMLLDLDFRAKKASLLKASYVRYLDEAKKFSAGVAITQSPSTKDYVFIVGASWAINHMTTVKARIDTCETFKTLLNHSIRDKACLTISAEFDTKDLNGKPGIGLAIALEL